jgi:hypothetical protein
VTLKENSEAIMKLLIDEIAQPSFYADIGELQEIEMIQGNIIVRPAHYEKTEQFVCAIDGVMQIKLIPPVFRQEVYSGKDKIIVDPEAEEATTVSHNLKNLNLNSSSASQEQSKVHLSPT